MQHKANTYCGCFFFPPLDFDGCSVLVFILPLPGPPPIPLPEPPPVPEEPDEGGLLGGIFIFLTDSRMICLIVLRNALRNSDVLEKERSDSKYIGKK